MVKDGDVQWDDLDCPQQQLIEDFDQRRPHKALDKVLEQKVSKQQPYRGAGAETQTTG